MEEEESTQEHPSAAAAAPGGPQAAGRGTGVVEPLLTPLSPRWGQDPWSSEPHAGINSHIFVFAVSTKVWERPLKSALPHEGLIYLQAEATRGRLDCGLRRQGAKQGHGDDLLHYS